MQLSGMIPMEKHEIANWDAVASQADFKASQIFCHDNIGENFGCEE